jgi:hypothetical protein
MWMFLHINKNLKQNCSCFTFCKQILIWIIYNCKCRYAFMQNSDWLVIILLLFHWWSEYIRTQRVLHGYPMPELWFTNEWASFYALPPLPPPSTRTILPPKPTLFCRFHIWAISIYIFSNVEFALSTLHHVLPHMLNILNKCSFN